MKVNLDNRGQVEATLAAVNGNASAHVLTALDVESLAARVESMLEKAGLPKSDRRGVAVSFSPVMPGHSCKSYARKARYVWTTRVRLYRGPRGWFLIGAERFEQWADSPERLVVKLEKAQAETIQKKAVEPFFIAA